MFYIYFMMVNTIQKYENNVVWVSVPVLQKRIKAVVIKIKIKNSPQSL